ncbi:hypothetical protein K683_1656 [Campylobacter jejuni HB-CJGB-LC]|nr:hypothetical protein K683_1656 [Campylobacter jejuni HB-CJGB-LC]
MEFFISRIAFIIKFVIIKIMLWNIEISIVCSICLSGCKSVDT